MIDRDAMPWRKRWRCVLMKHPNKPEGTVYANHDARGMRFFHCNACGKDWR